MPAKKIVLGFGSLLLLAVLGIMGVAATQPDDYTVQKSIMIQADPDRPYHWVGDIRNWEAWSPWKERDPTIVNQYQEPFDNVGGAQSWTSKNSGSGTLTFTEVIPMQSLSYRLVFDDWNSESIGKVEFVRSGSGATAVTWSMAGRHDFFDKIFWLLFSIEDAINQDFTTGLTKLKTLSEAQPAG